MRWETRYSEHYPPKSDVYAMNKKEAQQIIENLTREISSSPVKSPAAQFMIGNVGRVLAHSVFGEPGLESKVLNLEVQNAATIRLADMNKAIDLGNNIQLWVPAGMMPGGPREGEEDKCPHCGQKI